MTDKTQMNKIMDKGIDDLIERRSRGHQIASPQQGIHPVSSGMAETMNLKLDNPESWNFIQLYAPENENKCYHFIFQQKSTLEYVEKWRRSLIDYIKYEIEIEVSFFQLGIYNDQCGSSVLESLYVINVAQAIESILACQVTLNETNKAHIFIKYATKCTTPSEPEQLAEIDNFKILLEEYLQAVSIHTDLGYSYVNENVSKPETFWKMERTFSITQINVDELKALDIILCQGGDVRKYSQMLSTLNSLASFRAQVVYGFECVKSCLKERVEARQDDLFNLGKSQRRYLRKTICNSVKCWLIANNGGVSEKQIHHISNTSSQLYVAATHKYWELLLIELQKLELGIENLEDEFKKLKKLRNSLSHLNNDKYGRQGYESAMKLIRAVLKKHIQTAK
jgi:hypothetical protein